MIAKNPAFQNDTDVAYEYLMVDMQTLRHHLINYTQYLQYFQVVSLGVFVFEDALPKSRQANMSLQFYNIQFNFSFKIWI